MERVRCRSLFFARPRIRFRNRKMSSPQEARQSHKEENDTKTSHYCCTTPRSRTTTAMMEEEDSISSNMSSDSSINKRGRRCAGEEDEASPRQKEHKQGNDGGCYIVCWHCVDQKPGCICMDPWLRVVTDIESIDGVESEDSSVKFTGFSRGRSMTNAMRKPSFPLLLHLLPRPRRLWCLYRASLLLSLSIPTLLTRQRHLWCLYQASLLLSLPIRVQLLT